MAYFGAVGGVADSWSALEVWGVAEAEVVGAELAASLQVVCTENHRCGRQLVGPPPPLVELGRRLPREKLSLEEAGMREQQSLRVGGIGGPVVVEEAGLSSEGEAD